MADVLRLSFRFFSNLHLHGRDAIAPAERLFNASPARNACFLGNIGDPRTQVYQQFLWATAKRYDRVFVVAGRCEYAGLSDGCKGIDKYLDDLCMTMGNCYYLQESAVRIDQRLIVAGGTFRKGGQQNLLNACREEYARERTITKGSGQTLLLSHHLFEMDKTGVKGSTHWVSPSSENEIFIDGHRVPSGFTLPF